MAASDVHIIEAGVLPACSPKVVIVYPGRYDRIIEARVLPACSPKVVIVYPGRLQPNHRSRSPPSL